MPRVTRSDVIKPALRRLGGLLLLIGISLLSARPAAAIDPPVIDPWQQAQQMGRGLNVLGYDPIWKDPAKAHFKTQHFAAIRAAGFSTLRVNLAAFAHMNAANELDPQWLQTLDWVVAGASAQGLNVILDEHDYDRCGKDAVSCREKLMAFWQQIAARYRDAADNVLFELLNEPNGQMTPALWNRDLAELLTIVRRDNPGRSVIIGPANYNDFQRLGDLKLPEDDRHIIVTIHYYAPLTFTHQGAPWVMNGALPTGVTWGSPAEYQAITDHFDLVARWSKAQQRPIFLGEFGAYDKGAMTSRAAYTAAVARAAEAHGWPWAYWQFDSDFIAYDMKRQSWVEPILKALVP
ncbi:MAG TPA: glycoside hydrolase family 5 protein [Dongiaceae bacterium]